MNTYEDATNMVILGIGMRGMPCSYIEQPRADALYEDFMAAIDMIDGMILQEVTGIGDASEA